MLTPFYWVVKTSLTGENIYAYPPSLIPVKPHLYNYVDVWYLIPFPRYLLNSLIVPLIAVGGNLVLNAIAGYALTLPFPGRPRGDRSALCPAPSFRSRRRSSRPI